MPCLQHKNAKLYRLCGDIGCGCCTLFKPIALPGSCRRPETSACNMHRHSAQQQSSMHSSLNRNSQVPQVLQFSPNTRDAALQTALTCPFCVSKQLVFYTKVTARGHDNGVHSCQLKTVFTEECRVQPACLKNTHSSTDICCKRPTASQWHPINFCKVQHMQMRSQCQCISSVCLVTRTLPCCPYL
jgi:hypothetical protein